MNETTVTVIGNVASDLKVRRVGESGDLVTGFRVASSERRWDRGTESWIDGDRFSAWVSCWRRLGEGVLLSLAKGDPVVVTGRLSVREYEQNGERRFATEIAATGVGPDLSRSAARIRRRRAGEALEAPAGAATEGGVETSVEAAVSAALEAAAATTPAPGPTSAGAPVEARGDTADEGADDRDAVTETDADGGGAVLSLVG